MALLVLETWLVVKPAADYNFMSQRLFLLLCSVAFFGAFVFFSYLVGHEHFHQLDFDITVKLQDHISRRFDFPFSVLSLMGTAEFTTLFWLLLTGFFIFKRMWWTTLSMFLFFVSVAIELFGKIFLEHPSPPFLFYRGVLDINFPSQFVHSNYSYPSGHVTRTAFLLLMVIFYLYFKEKSRLSPIIQLGLLGFLFLMILSRVYLGEHWTTDVFGGLLLGTSLAFFAAITLTLKTRKVSAEPASAHHAAKNQ
jgi:undecaprenyl-diphosphatase